jgi:hypothetical protein
MREESDRRKRNIMLFSVNTTKSTEASLGPNGIGSGVFPGSSSGGIVPDAADLDPPTDLTSMSGCSSPLGRLSRCLAKIRSSAGAEDQCRTWVDTRTLWITDPMKMARAGVEIDRDEL